MAFVLITLPVLAGLVQSAPSKDLREALPTPRHAVPWAPGQEAHLDALAELVLAELPQRGCLGVFFDPLGDVDGLLMVVRALEKPFAVRLSKVVNGPADRRWSERCDSFLILIGRDVQPGNMEQVVEGSLARVHTQHPARRFVFAWTGSCSAPSQAVLDATMRAVWKRGHLNVVALAPSARGNGSYAIHSYHPFDSSIGCFDTSARVVATWVNKSGLNLVSGNPAIFRFGSLRLLRHIKLSGCPIKVGFKNVTTYLTATLLEGGWQLKGMGYNILKACEKALSFKIQLVEPPPRPRETWNGGLLSAVLAGRLDLALLPGAFTLRDSLNVTVCGWFNQWCFTIAVPVGSGGNPPLYYPLTASFTGQAWLLVASSLLLAAAVCRLLVRAERDARGADADPWTDGRLLRLILDTMVGRTVRAHFLPRHTPMRTFFSTWMYVGLVLSTAYTAALRSIVAAPPHPWTIQNVEQLARSDLPIYSSEYSRKQMLQAARAHGHFAEIVPRLRRAESPDDLKAILEGGSGAVVARRDWLVHQRRVLSGPIGPLGPDAFYIFYDYCLYGQYAFPFLLTPNSPLSKSLRRVLFRLAEVGLQKHWTEKDTWTAPVIDRHFRDLAKKRKVLTMHDLSFVFSIYAIGLGVVCVVFALELLCSWLAGRTVATPWHGGAWGIRTWCCRYSWYRS